MLPGKEVGIVSAVIIQNKKGRIFIINKLSYPEEVNLRVSNAISSGMIPGCLPVEVKTKHKETIIECAVEKLLTLEQFFQGAVTKQMFLNLVHRIAQIIIGCEKTGINPNGLDLRIDRIFIDPASGEVKCIYWPVLNSQVSANPQQFLQQLPYYVKINPNQDYSYLNQYVAFFNTNQAFNIRSFDNMLSALYNNRSLPNAEATAVGAGQSSGRLNGRTGAPSGPIGGAAAGNTPSRDLTLINDITVCPSCGAENLAVSNFCIICGTKLSKASALLEKIAPSENISEEQGDKSALSDKNTEQTAKNNTEQSTGSQTSDAAQDNSNDIIGTTVLFDTDSAAYSSRNETEITASYTGNISAEEGTVVEGYNNPQEKAVPVLTRLKNGERTVIDKPVFKIGSARDSCNMVITENRYISRIHAYIVTRNGRLFIIDRNSTNKTYVDGKAIPTEIEVEIFNDTKIKFANEEFIFNIE